MKERGSVVDKSKEASVVAPPFGLLIQLWNVGCSSDSVSHFFSLSLFLSSLWPSFRVHRYWCCVRVQDLHDLIRYGICRIQFWRVHLGPECRNMEDKETDQVTGGCQRVSGLVCWGSLLSCVSIVYQLYLYYIHITFNPGMEPVWFHWSFPPRTRYHECQRCWQMSWGQRVT